MITYMRLTQNPIFAMIALTALILASCEKNIDSDKENFPADGVVRIDASVSDLMTKADLPYSGYTGSDLGLFIDYGDGDYYSKDNVRWVNNSGTWTPESQVLGRMRKVRSAYSPMLRTSAGRMTTRVSSSPFLRIRRTALLPPISFGIACLILSLPMIWSTRN